LYTADSLAKYTNYFVSVALIPAFYGSAFGLAGAHILRQRIAANKATTLLLILSGIIAALTPTAIYIIAASTPHDQPL